MAYGKENLSDTDVIFKKSNGTCKCIGLHIKTFNLVIVVFSRPPGTKA